MENPPVTKKRSPLGLVFLTLFIDMIGFGIVIPVLPLYAKNSTGIHASEAQLGWIVGIYSLLQFVFSPIIGKISDRVGRKPVLAISILGTAVGFAILGAATTVTMLLVGRIIDGISGGNISTAMACIADSTTREERSRSMGMVGAAFGLGFIIGPAFGGILSLWGHSVPFYVASVLALINASLVILRLPETLTPESRARAKQQVSIREVFGGGHAKTVTLVLLSQLAGIAGFSVMTALFAIFCANRYGYDAAHVGYVLAYVGLLGAVMQGGIVRRLLKKPIEKPLAVIGTAVLALSMGLLALLPPGSGGGSLALLMLVCAGISIGNSLSTPSLNGLASRTVDAHCQGRLMGLMQSAGALGRFCGPMLGYSLTRLDSFQYWPAFATDPVTMVGYTMVSAGSQTHYGRIAFIASAVLLAFDCLLLLGLRVAPHAPEPAAESEAA